MTALLSGLAFTTPLALIGLLALPVIWWLLRFTPPKPQQIKFPPFRLLLDLINREEQPQHTPWWVLLLRLAMAAAIILAVAGPLLNASSVRDRSGDPLLMVLDDSWATAPNWQQRQTIIQGMLDDAVKSGALTAIASTTSAKGGRVMELADAETTRELAATMTPKALSPDRLAMLDALPASITNADNLRVVWLSDGLTHNADADFTEKLAALSGGNARVEVLMPETAGIPAALLKPTLDASKLTIEAVRADSTAETNSKAIIRAINGRTLGEADLVFKQGDTTTKASLELPLELRNEAARIEIANARTAAGVYLFDDRWRRKSVAMLSGASQELEQPLLSPLYYVSRALQPSAEISEVASVDNIPDAINAGISVMVLADIGVLGSRNVAVLNNWIENGGVIIRFAGPRLAGGHDGLVPVDLRTGGRSLGSALSWDQPQGLSDFAPDTPFAGLQNDATVKISRQVLAEPSATLPGLVWASLQDGTPLVTAKTQGKGLVILFHTTANADWSNLPLSGLFVEMLKRIADIAPAAGSIGSTKSAAENASAASSNEGAFTPIRTLTGFGELVNPTASATPVETDAFFKMQPTPQHPAGLYSRAGARHALNLDATEGNSKLTLLENLPSSMAVTGYERARPTELAGWLFALALALFAIDCLAMLYLTGGIARLKRQQAATAAIVTVGIIVMLPAQSVLAQSTNSPAQQQTANAAEQFAMQSSLETRIGYVLTGDNQIDSTSRMGMEGLSRILHARTSIEPADPIGIDIENDVIVFFPLLYWPVLENATPPDDKLLAKLSDYMKNGGTIFFDTRDDNASTASLTGAPSPATLALRGILERLDVPSLEPVPDGHVLTRAFYLLDTFPGRWASGQLWVEARTGNEQDGIKAAASDGVSSIIIGSNDYASAWATDENGRPQFPVSPGGEGQREYAWRTGINIMMYTLTGNYKADQVHVPALLERLGQ